MNVDQQPPASAPRGASVPSSPELAKLLQQPYRADDPAYAAALWRATVQRLAALGGPPSHPSR